jgi:hypothetical protein
MRKMMTLAAMLAMMMVVAAPAIASEQDSDSGDVSQSFNVSNTGDNSNQCAGVQGVANTGSAQNSGSVEQTDEGNTLNGGDNTNDNDALLNQLSDQELLQLGLGKFTGEQNNEQIGAAGASGDLTDKGDSQSDSSEFGDVEFSGDSSVEVNPSNSTDCNQSVNQSATTVYYAY